MARASWRHWGTFRSLRLSVLVAAGVSLSALQQPWRWRGMAILGAAFALPRERRPDKREGPKMSNEDRKLLMEVREGVYNPDELQEIAADMLENNKLSKRNDYMVFSKQLCRNGLWEASLALMASWQERNPGKELDRTICNQALAAMCKGQCRERAVEMLARMEEGRVQSDAVGYNIIMVACQEAKEWRRTLDLFDDMRKLYRKPDHYTFNYAVGACAMGREWRRAIDLMNELLRSSRKKEDMGPDWRMFNLGIIMSGNGGQWETALRFLGEMWEREVLPDGITYDNAIRVCKRCHRWEEALHLVRDMRRKGFRPEEQTYAAAAASCRSCGQEQLAETLEREAQLLLA